MKFGGLSGRTLRSVVALCLPTVVVVAFGIYFLLVDVPRIVRDEHARVISELREAADALREDVSKADFKWVREQGIVSGDLSLTNAFPATMTWREWNPLRGDKRSGMFGIKRYDFANYVWIRGTSENDASSVYAKKIDIEEHDYAFTFYLFGPIFLFVLCGMTFIGVKYFVDYVRSRDDFLAATAHDLTTPLVGMRYSIGRCDDDAKVLNERLIRLVENIKDFMKLGGKRPVPKREPFDIVKAYSEAYAIFRDDYRDLFDDEDVPVENSGVPNVVGDETMTVQILWNLLGNDLKYAAPYGAVKVRFFVDGKFVKVEFVDEGQGMTPRQMRRAFDRYYRAKTVLESGKGGFGIGLCSAREFALAMGGDLTVRANTPHGCIFSLSLPLCEE